MRAPDAQLGGVDGAGVTYLQCAAERLESVPDASQDVVLVSNEAAAAVPLSSLKSILPNMQCCTAHPPPTLPHSPLPPIPRSQSHSQCVYLFHELPPEARRAAAAEMARVLKPGGIVVLTDSVQVGVQWGQWG